MAADGSADVSDFLQKIKDLGDTRDREDEARNRKLELEILEGKKQRQARRAERARSISPTKSSPANTPTPSARASIALPQTLSPSPTFNITPKLEPRAGNAANAVEDAMSRLTGADNSLAREIPAQTERGTGEHASAPISPMRLQSTDLSSRNSPLPWQRRPVSQASTRSQSRPLSRAAPDNAARSPDPAHESAEQPVLTREQIAESLASKDPAWFRQTADRGAHSPAYRRQQVEDMERADHSVNSDRVPMPGMSQESSELGNMAEEPKDLAPVRNSAAFGGAARMSRHRPTSSIGSPIPLTSAQRFDPPSVDGPSETRGLAMSPTQGRMSPDRLERSPSRLDRSPSPTKGMGGFVQSAMMKRTDSVNKRWSVTSPGLNRGSSYVSNRQSYDSSPRASTPVRELLPSGLSRDDSPRPLSRPTSSHATNTQEDQRPGTASSAQDSVVTPALSDGLAKSSLPVVRPHTPLEVKTDVESDCPPSADAGLPVSPTRITDQRRWSPTKSSWLESALSRPDSPKPKPKPAPSSQQPAWMTEMTKSKQLGSADATKASPAVKHSVNIGGLMRSPPPGPLANSPLSLGGMSGGFKPGITPPKRSGTINTQDMKISPTRDDGPLSAGLTSGLDRVARKASPAIKPKPLPSQTNDFRSVLKSRQLPTSNGGEDEPEFKNVFGQLRKTKTRNYVAPDVLKQNITQGKADLHLTDGPKPTEHKDEFKEAIMKKKDDFRQSQIEGKGILTNSSPKTSTAVPEALARRKTLSSGSRNHSISGISPAVSPPLELSPDRISPPGSSAAEMTPTLVSPVKEVPGHARLQSKEGGSKLAARFNPALAGMLARGPPSANGANSRSSSPSTQRNVSISTSPTNLEVSEQGPQLSHMTKGRARGPKRKAPSTTAAAIFPATNKAEPVAVETKVTLPTLQPLQKMAIEQPEPVVPEVKNTTPESQPIQETEIEQPEPAVTEVKAPAPMSQATQNLAIEQLEPETVEAKEAAPVSQPLQKLSVNTVSQTPPAQPNEVGNSPQPLSPRKLDPNRRSNFLQKVEGAEAFQSGSPQPLSPKNANSYEMPLATQTKAQHEVSEPTKPTQSVPLQTAGPDVHHQSPAVSTFRPATRFAGRKTILEMRAEQASAALSAQNDLETRAEDVKSKTRAESQAMQTNLNTSTQVIPGLRAEEVAASITKEAAELKSVKTAAASWDKPTESVVGAPPPRVRSPIKLPAQADEQSAMKFAGLRPTSPMKQAKDNALSIQTKPASAGVPASPSRWSRPLPSPPKKGPIITSKPLPSPTHAQITESKALPSPSAQDSPQPSPGFRSGVPQASDASALIAEFFGKDVRNPRSFTVDSAALLTASSVEGSNIKTLQANLSLLSSDGKKLPVPSHQERILFEREMYLCVHSFTKPAGKKLIEVYFWVGDEVPTSDIEEVEIFVQREAKSARGTLVKIKQGKETPAFFSALGGVLIVRRGSSAKFDSLAPHVLCARKHFEQIALDEVDYSPQSLCSGFPYLISTLSGKSYLWTGRGSGVDELGCARLVGMELGLTGEIEEIEEGKETEAFLQSFANGAKIPKSADHWRMKPNYSKYCSRLFCADAASQSQIEEVSPFCQTDLSPANIYVLDAFFEIYIIIGSKAQAQYAAFHNALLFGQEYAILAAGMEDRPFVPISSVVVEGCPKDLKSVFRKWVDSLSPTIMQTSSERLRRGRSLRVVPLTAALEATRM